MSAPSGLAAMHPAYFALTMATGIVSLAAQLMGYGRFAFVLLPLNAVFYCALWVCTILRVMRHRDRFVADLFHHGRSVGFFTTVAATNVLGSQLLIVGGVARAAFVLWLFGILLWATLVYAVFTIMVVKPEKPTLAEGLNGGWLVAVVASQSVAVLGAQLAPSFESHRAEALFACTVMWLGGGMLYLWIISLIFLRYAFYVMSPSDLAPPYWINMGAAAITTLAGTMLVGAAPSSPVLMQILPFVRGFTMFWWATASWWIPMLVILGIWRHVVRKFPVAYDPLYWGAVFPLGMYTVCTARLSQAIDAPYLLSISRVFVVVAIVAWSMTLLGMVRALSGMTKRIAPGPSGP